MRRADPQQLAPCAHELINPSGVPRIRPAPRVTRQHAPCFGSSAVSVSYLIFLIGFGKKTGAYEYHTDIYGSNCPTTWTITGYEAAFFFSSMWFVDSVAWLLKPCGRASSEQTACGQETGCSPTGSTLTGYRIHNDRFRYWPRNNVE